MNIYAGIFMQEMLVYVLERFDTIMHMLFDEFFYRNLDSFIHGADIPRSKI